MAESTGGKSNKLTLKVGISLNKGEAVATIKKQFSQIQKEVKKDTTIDLKVNNGEKARKEIKSTEKSVSAFRKEAGKLKTTLNALVMFTLVSRVFMGVQNVFKNAFQFVRELDTEFVNFQIVTGATAGEVSYLNDRVTELSGNLKKLKQEVINSVTEFSRAGYELADSLMLAESALVGSNVGFVSLDKVTKYLIAGLKTFNLEAKDSYRIIDSLFKVSNKTAIDMEGLGEAFLRSANSLRVAGASIEQTTALIAGANETIQDATKVGTALKTVSARLRGIGEDGESIPTLAGDFKRLGVDIQNADGSFRNIYDIFREFAQVYQNLSDIEAQEIIEKLAGKRQANIIIGLLNNWEVAEMALTEAIDSRGSALLANEDYLDSVEGKVKSLQNTIKQFYENILDSDTVKNFLGLIEGIVGVVDILINKIPVLTTVTLAFVAATLPITGFASLLGVVASAIGALYFGLRDITKFFGMFGESVEDMTNQIQKYNDEIDDLNKKISNLSGLKNRTKAEENLLDIYKQQRAERQRLLDLENQNLADKLVEDLEKSANSMESYLNKIQENLELNEFNGGDVFTTTDFNSWLSILTHIEKKYLENNVAIQDLMETLGEESVLYADLERALENNIVASEELVRTKILLGDTTAKQSAYIDDESDATDALTQKYRLLNEESADAKRQQDLVNEAIIQVTDNGYLSEQMITDLIANGYVELVQKLSEGEDAFTNYGQSIYSNNKGIVENTLESVKTQIEALQALADAQGKMANALNQNFLRQGGGLSDRNILSEMGFDLKGAEYFLEDATQNFDKEIKDWENLSLILENRLKELEDTTYKAFNPESSKRRGSKQEPSTELERLIDNLNNRLAITEKLLARTEVESEKIALLEKRRDIYYELQDALEQQNNVLAKNLSATSKTSAEYDKILKELNSTKLAYEDTKNSINDINKSIIEMTILMGSLNDEIQKSNYQIQYWDAILNRIKSPKARMTIMEEQISVYERLLVQYENEKKNLDAVGKTLEKGTNAYREYIAESRNLSLQIENTRNAMFNLNSEISDMTTELLDLDSVKDIISEIEELVKQGLKDQIDRRKELIDLAQEELNLKLKQIEAEKDLNDFTKSRADKEAEIAKISARLESLRTAVAQGDNRAVQEAMKLEEEQAELQGELDEMINDRSYELKKEGLQNEFEEYKKTQQSEIDVFEDRLNDASYITQSVNQKLNAFLSGSANTLYNDLINWNRSYGTGIDNDIISKWEKAIGLIKQYKSTLQGSSLDVYSYGNEVSANSNTNNQRDSIIAQMMVNSSKWNQASQQERIRLHKENKELAKSIGYFFNDKDGRYYNSSGAKLYDNGGRFNQGDVAVKANPTLEWITRDDQLQKIVSMGAEQAIASLGSNTSGITEFNLIVEGDITDNNVDKVTGSIQDAVQQVTKGQLSDWKKIGVKPNKIRR